MRLPTHLEALTVRTPLGAPFFARALLPLLLLAPLAARGVEPAPNEVQIPIDERQYRAAGIEIVRVEPEGGTTQTILPGTVSVPPQQLRVVAAPAAGLVEAILVAPNEPVTEGQPIARLRSTDLLEAQRTYLQALSAERLAAEKLRRDEQMHRERIIAERRLLTTRADHDYARTTLQEREQMLALLGMAEGDIRAVRDQRRMVPALTVSAPADGVVLEVRATAGERIAPAAPLFSIAQLDPLWITLQMPLSQANAIVPGTRVGVPGTPAQGEVIRLGRSVDAATQSLAAVVEVSDGAETLRPGQVVTASVALRPNGTPQWRLPSGAVVRHAGQSWVFVRSAQGFRARPVVVIAETASTVSIRASLTADDQVATRGILSLLAELTEIYGG
jgi:cobalt-zinc-cadmium efflux system membrane fusion protein